MSKLLGLLLLIDGLTIIFAGCPDSPTLPTSVVSSSNPFTVTPTSPGMTNFDTSTRTLSFTLTVTPTEICTAGSTFHVFSLTVIQQEILAMSISCTGAGFLYQIRSDYSSPLSGTTTAFPSVIDSMNVYFSVDLQYKYYVFEILTRTYQDTGTKTMTMSQSLTFDDSTKLYICSGYKGTVATPCEVSYLKLFYRYIGSSSMYGYAGGSTSATAAFFSLTDGPGTSLANTIDSTRPGYFGDSPTSPTSGTMPTWDSSNAFVNINNPAQFLSFPMPSIITGPEGISSSFAIAAWVKVSSVTASTTMFRICSSDGVTDRFKLTVTSGYDTKVYVGTTYVDFGAYFNRNVWTIIIVTFVIRGDNNAVFGGTFASQQTDSYYKNVYHYTGATITPASTDILRIGDGGTSFVGSVSGVRIISPASGFIRDSSTACINGNGLELGLDSFALSCSSSASFNILDNKCYSSCPSGSGPVTTIPSKSCVACPANCAQCTNHVCQTCNSNYRLYANDATCYASGACPARTYETSTNCIDCPDPNCAQCDISGCQSCAATYLIHSGDQNCYTSSTCPSRTYTNTTHCVDCFNCIQCDSSGCQQCDTNYLSHIGDPSCYTSSTCPSGTYATATNCVDCAVANCAQCDSSACQQCDATYRLYSGDGICYASNSCPSKTYPNTTNCVDCSANCDQCDISGCQSCAATYLIHSGDQNCYTSSTCPSRTYPSTTHCVDCSANCAQCNSAGCVRCISPMVLINGLCQCPSYTVLNLTTSSCDYVSYIDLIYQSPVSPFADLFIHAQILPEEEASYPPVISWTITSSTADPFLLTSLRMFISSQKTKLLFVLSSYLQANTSYNVQANYTNPQGHIISKQAVIQTTDLELQVSFRGGPSQTLDYSQDNTISAEVISSTGDVPSSLLDVQWTQSTNSTNYGINLASLTSSQAPFLLTIPKCTFHLGNDYNFTITVQETGTTNTPSSANLSILSVSPRLIVAISNGNRGQKAGEDLLLSPVLSLNDGCNLVDINTVVNMTTRQDAWECTKIDSQGMPSACNDSLSIFSPPQGTTSLTVPASYFSQDIGAQFVFKITVSIMANSTTNSSNVTVFMATNETSFTILSVDSPSVNITQNMFGVPSTYEVVLSSNIQHSYTYAWEFTPNIQYVYFISKLKVLSDLTQLTPLANVRANMMATNELSVTTSLYIQLPINQSPQNGSVIVLPTSGTSLGTVFSIGTYGWIDEDIPLTYEFLYSQNEASGYRPLCASQFASSLTSELVSYGINSYVYVKAIVTDTFGGTESNHTKVSVTASTDISQTTSTIQDLLSLGSDISPAQMISLLLLESDSLTSLETAYLSSSSTSARCPLCSGHGHCSRYECICDSEYTLSDCSMSQIQFDSILSTKSSILDVMMQTMNRTKLDSTMKEMISESLELLSSHSTFNNLQTMKAIQNNVEAALNLSNSQTILSLDESSSVANTLSNMLTYASVTDPNLTEEFNRGLEAKMNQYITIISNSLLSDKLPGENPSIITTANFDIDVFKTTLCSLSGSDLTISPKYPSIQISLLSNAILTPEACEAPLDVRFYGANAGLFYGKDPNRTVIALDISNSGTGRSIDTSKVSVTVIPQGHQECPVDCDKFKERCLCANIFDVKAQFAIIFTKSNIDKLGNVGALLSSLIGPKFWKSLPVWTAIVFTSWFLTTLFIIKTKPNLNIANKYRDNNMTIKVRFEKIRILFMITHPILSIYFYKNSQISKVTKLILYYQQVILLLAYTAIFPTASSEKMVLAKIILIVIKSLTVTPLVFIIALLIKDPDPEQDTPNTWFQRHRKRMGIILAILSAIAAIYIIFVVAAQTDTDVQQGWTVNFLIVIIQGILVTPPLNLCLQIWLVIYMASRAMKTSHWRKSVLLLLVNRDVDRLYRQVYLGKARTVPPTMPVTTTMQIITEQRGTKYDSSPTFAEVPPISLEEIEEVPVEIPDPSDTPSARKIHNREIGSVKMLSSGKESWRMSLESSPNFAHMTQINFTVNNESSPINSQRSEDRCLRSPSTPTGRSQFFKYLRSISRSNMSSISREDKSDQAS